MATSTTLNAKRALYTALSARPALAGVLISRGADTTDLMTPELIMLGDITPSTQAAAALGRQRREEDYTLAIEVSVLAHHADDPDTPAERCEALVAEIEDELRTNIDLGGVVRTAQVTGVGLREGSDGQTRWAEMPVSVSFRQRI